MSDDTNSNYCDEGTPAAGDALSGLEGEDALDTVFALLADQRRRHFLYVLEAHGETLTLADAADEVAELEYRRPLSEIAADTVMQVYMSLYHSHVPKLTGAGVVKYDQDEDLVTLVPPAECEYTDALVALVKRATARDLR